MYRIKFAWRCGSAWASLEAGISSWRGANCHAKEGGWRGEEDTLPSSSSTQESLFKTRHTYTRASPSRTEMTHSTRCLGRTQPRIGNHLTFASNGQPTGSPTGPLWETLHQQDDSSATECLPTSLFRPGFLAQNSNQCVSPQVLPGSGSADFGGNSHRRLSLALPFFGHNIQDTQHFLTTGHTTQ